ncbi:uncharacterized protein N7459_009992 [Penicillium hispanicum]|uniref:uncharacterized protein n=1 Tax=Penicillium hispanicum TaxID=1080232 RepID=UPI002541093C|nr:uncharacterized protein N7459_009992 [Penicillium hispanicum]KAJ5570562.1 hypothetical protein N7459_009992 [Penicillium hispanicum]
MGLKEHQFRILIASPASSQNYEPDVKKMIRAFPSGSVGSMPWLLYSFLLLATGLATPISQSLHLNPSRLDAPPDSIPPLPHKVRPLQPRATNDPPTPETGIEPDLPLAVWELIAEDLRGDPDVITALNEVQAGGSKIVVPGVDHYYVGGLDGSHYVQTLPDVFYTSPYSFGIIEDWGYAYFGENPPDKRNRNPEAWTWMYWNRISEGMSQDYAYPVKMQNTTQGILIWEIKNIAQAYAQACSGDVYVGVKESINPTDDINGWDVNSAWGVSGDFLKERAASKSQNGWLPLGPSMKIALDGTMYFPPEMIDEAIKEGLLPADLKYPGLNEPKW